MQELQQVQNECWVMVFNATFKNISVIYLDHISIYHMCVCYNFMVPRGRDRMVVGFTTTCATSAHHH